MRTQLYSDEKKVAAVTMEIVAAGETILQVHKLAGDDVSHVSVMLDYFEPAQDAKVLDVGCGLGTIASLMQEERPDLEFTLLNISPYQLGLCPGFPKIAGDMDGLPCTDESFDAVLVNYALGHGEISTFMKEAWRVLSRGGILFIYDLAAKNNEDCLRELEYVAYHPSTVLSAAHISGFVRDLVFHPETSVLDFVRLFGRADYERMFSGALPVIYRFVKLC